MNEGIENHVTCVADSKEIIKKKSDFNFKVFANDSKIMVNILLDKIIVSFRL